MSNIVAKQQGKLYIFLGYASGVGKTHTMLNVALEQHDQGHDVGIAYVKTFANAGYKDLINQIQHLPTEQSKLATVDVDAIINRKPKLVVIDEFQEANPYGSTYLRRYQEIQAILDAGIDVYTTLTIYYLDSLSDIVEQVIGIRVDNTVPDRLIQQAHYIQLVDTPIETVMQRIKHQTVAPMNPDHKSILFTEQSLMTLRQLAVRHSSHWLEAHTHPRLNNHRISGALTIQERLLVCISPSPLSSKLIRTAYQLAHELKAEWTAVYIERTSAVPQNEESQNQLIQNMHLVEKLGGKVVTIHGESIPDAIMKYAVRHDMTKIIIGYSAHSRWYHLFNRSVSDRLIQQNVDRDIYVIGSGQPAEEIVNFNSQRSTLQWKKYLITVVIIIATTLIDIFINPFVFPATLVTLYLIGISAAATYLGYRPALIATILSVVSFFFFFVPSSVDTPVEALSYVVILIGLLIAGVILTRFISRALETAEHANRRADQMMELYSLSRDLSTTIAFDGIIETIMKHVEHTFQAEVCIYLSQNDKLSRYQSTFDFDMSETEMAAIYKAYELGQTTGISTPTHSTAKAIYIPLRTAYKKVGVMGVAFIEKSPPTLDQHRLLDAFANQAALAIEASRLVEQGHQVRLAHEREKLQSALLDSISHDIRTPLVSITGALSSLRDEAALFDAEVRRELIDDAWSDLERLNRLVENILEMSRLQSGEMKLNRDWHDLDEIIAVARSQLRGRLQGYQIITHIQQEVALTYVDFMLMVQVLVNLLDNAAKYSNQNKVIEICTMTRDQALVLQVADNGIGIPEKELPHIFGKFYRASNVAQFNGTGLGLSICVGIVEIHNGTIHAFNRPDGGAIFEVRLPMEINTYE